MGAEKDLTDPDAVVKALAEFDEIGREQFLKKYGIGPAYRYRIVFDGKHYDAKAVIGAAYGNQFPDKGPLKGSDFQSNEHAVKDLLEGLGFDVEIMSHERALLVYVGDVVKPNYKHGLEAGIWGFTKKSPAYDQLAKGDLIVFGVHGTGSGPRVSADEWGKSVLSEVVIGRLTGPLYEDHTPEWADESESLSYPYRVRFEVEASKKDVPLSPGHLGPKVIAGLKGAGSRGRVITQPDGSLFDNLSDEGSGTGDVTEIEFALDLALVSEEVAAKGLTIDPDVILAIVAALQSGKHVVLTGPPGTGKTTLAEAIAIAARKSQLCAGHILSTATSDWTTFETIGGLRPNADTQLEFVPGQFLSAITSRQWLVVDEMNRSNFDRAFGQLFTVLSGQSVVLPYADSKTNKPIKLMMEGVSQESAYHAIRVPKHWRMIATMNVFDKSLLFEMSFALMRRFAFIEVPVPTQSVYEDLIRSRCGPSGSDEALAVFDLVTPLLGLRTLKELGPSMFMDMARFALERRAIGHIDDDDLRFQLFYSYLLPQFEGISDPVAKELRTKLNPLVGKQKERLTQTLRDVLGAVLPAKVSSEGEDEQDES